MCKHKTNQNMEMKMIPCMEDQIHQNMNAQWNIF